MNENKISSINAEYQWQISSIVNKWLPVENTVDAKIEKCLFFYWKIFYVSMRML